MNHETFRKNIMYKKNSFIGQIARILEIDFLQVDLLKPTQIRKGVIFVLYIEHDYQIVKSILKLYIDNGEIGISLKKSFRLSEIPKVNHFLIETVLPQMTAAEIVEATFSPFDRSRELTPDMNSLNRILPPPLRLQNIDSTSKRKSNSSNFVRVYTPPMLPSSNETNSNMHNYNYTNTSSSATNKSGVSLYNNNSTNNNSKNKNKNLQTPELMPVVSLSSDYGRSSDN